MRFRDFQPALGVGPWQGLDLLVTQEDLAAAGAPGLRVEAGAARLRVTCGDAPLLWARIHRWHDGLWRLLPPRAASWQIVPPLRAADLAAVEAPAGSEAWWSAWARWMARALAASPRAPLYPGRWAISAARATDLPAPKLPGAPPADWSGLDHIDGARAALDAGALAWESWWTSGSGALLRARDPSPERAGRVRSWAKRARAGTLPPLLVLYVSGLDMFLLLDGHDRLRAALHEQAAPGFLVLWSVRATPRLPDPARQASVVRTIERKRLWPGRRPLDTDAENRVLVAAFDDRDWLWPRSRAYPLAGGAAAWDAEVAAQRVPADHRIFTGEPPER